MITVHSGRIEAASSLPFLPRAWVVAFWQWATLNADLVVLEVSLNLWIVRRKVEVRFRHLFPIFERILGRPVEDPTHRDRLRELRGSGL